MMQDAERETQFRIGRN